MFTSHPLSIQLIQKQIFNFIKTVNYKGEKLIHRLDFGEAKNTFK